jgi:hypothetical protein
MVLDLAKCDLTYYKWHTLVVILCNAANLDGYKIEDLCAWAETASLEDIKKIFATAREESLQQ